MADLNISILFDSDFGSEGTGNGQFKFPSGITILNNEVFVVDKQNHRIQVFNLLGVYQRQFGTVGAGNDQFFFPEGITNDGTDLYIVDSSNHRIKQHQVDGTYVSEFGSQGVGNNNFEYPVGILYYNNHLYITDKGNSRVKKHLTPGTFVLEFGSYGTGNSNLNFPEGITFINNFLCICDSGNEKVKFFNITGVYQYQISATYNYPVGSTNINDQSIVIMDRQDNKLLAYNDVGTLVSEYGTVGAGNDQLYFPTDSAWFDDKLYIVDQGNHRIKIVDFTITEDVPIYADDILKLTDQLYPTGRAWWLNIGSVFRNFHNGLAYSEARAYESAQNLLNSILPDNDDFDETDAANWESALGLLSNASLSLSVRKEAILRKMQHPGNIPARQHYLYLQRELQNAGFSVYVHENRVENPVGSGSYDLLEPYPVAALYGNIPYGGSVYGNAGLTYTAIANYIDESKDENFYFGNPVNLRSTFFIGGQIFSNAANVDIARKNEFRELILKIKPAQTAGFLLINYI